MRPLRVHGLRPRHHARHGDHGARCRTPEIRAGHARRRLQRHDLARVAGLHDQRRIPVRPLRADHQQRQPGRLLLPLGDLRGRSGHPRPVARLLRHDRQHQLRAEQVRRDGGLERRRTRGDRALRRRDALLPRLPLRPAGAALLQGLRPRHGSLDAGHPLPEELRSGREPRPRHAGRHLRRDPRRPEGRRGGHHDAGRRRQPLPDRRCRDGLQGPHRPADEGLRRCGPVRLVALCEISPRRLEAGAGRDVERRHLDRDDHAVPRDADHAVAAGRRRL